MKKILFSLFLFPIIILAQSNVEKLIGKLEQLSEGSLNNWKYSLDFSLSASELSKPNFDDSKWETLTLDQRIYPDSCWLRKVIELPKFIAGIPVIGKMKFTVSVDDYGYLWINGESKGHFPWDGDFTLTDNAISGTKYVLLIRAVNTGGPLRIIKANIAFPEEPEIQKIIRNFTLSLKVGQKLLSFDTYQTNARVRVDPGVDKSKMDREEKINLTNLLNNLSEQIDIDALSTGNVDKFTQSLNDVKKQLKPVSDFAKRFTLQFAANAHIDAAWLWRKKETMEVCNQTFSSVMNMFNSRPSFTYSQSQAALYKWMQFQQPELFQKIKDKVNEGRWEIVGGMWIEPDCNLPSGESWSHQLLYGQKYFEKNFGRKALIGWNPDSFGYNWNLPMFLTNSGIDVFITQKIGWNDTNVFPYRVFWWESPDKSKVLTYFPFDYVNTIENPYRLIDWLRQFESNTGFTKLLILFGVGNHGGGPSIEMMGRIDNLAQLDIFPKIEFGTAESYLSWLKAQELSEVPTWNSELYLEYHRGTLTTQSNTKKWNRKSEALLTTTEKFGTLAKSLGFSFNKDDLNDAWENVLFNQFHDILPGSSIREVYIDADKDYRDSYKIESFILDNSLDFISKQINTDKIKNAVPIIVFNPLSWERTDVATVQLPEGDSSDYSIFDLTGKEIPSQTVVKEKYEREIIFIADKVPALGYKTFQLKQQKATSQNTYLITADNSLENNLFKIIVCRKCGWVKSIFDKRNNKEILTDFGNRLQILEDKPSAWDAWNIGLTGTEYPSNFRRMEIVEQGPVRTVLRTYRDYLKPGVKKEFPTEDFPSSFFTQDIILYNDLDRIDFKTDVEWWEDKTMLKVAFPVNVTDTVATYEIPYGTIQRSTTLKAQWDKGKWEVPALRWADLSQNDYGISLLNKAKYGYDIKGNVMRLSLLRSPKWPDPTADRGNHSIEYALYPHTGKVMESKTIQRGYEYNYPLLVTITDTHKGKLPAENSFIQISPSNLILTSIKQAEDEDAWVIQLYETKGQDTEAVLTLANKPNKIFLSNFLEEDGALVKPEANKVKFNVSAYSVITLKLKF